MSGGHPAREGRQIRRGLWHCDKRMLLIGQWMTTPDRSRRVWLRCTVCYAVIEHQFHGKGRWKFHHDGDHDRMGDLVRVALGTEGIVTPIDRERRTHEQTCGVSRNAPCDCGLARFLAVYYYKLTPIENTAGQP